MKARIIIDIEFNPEPMKHSYSFCQMAWPNPIDYLKAVFIGSKTPNPNNGLMKIFSQNYRTDAFIPKSISVEAYGESGIRETCSSDHDYIKLPDHPKKDGLARCPYCLAIGWDKFKAELDDLRKD